MGLLKPFHGAWPRRLRYRVLLIVLACLLAFVVGPYLYSRAMSPSRALESAVLDSVKADDLPANEGPGVLRIACYNIAHGRGLAESNWGGGTRAQREQRLDEIAALLREVDADVVVLNECDFDASWSHSVNQATYLAERAAYPYVVSLRNLDFRVGFWTWRFGNAVLSRYPIAETREIDQPGYAKWETVTAGKKRTLFCEIGVGEQRVGIAAIHLSHRSEGLRADSAQNLVNFAKFYNHPLILAGDFNSAPSGFPGSQADLHGRNALDVIDGAGLFQRRPKQPPTDPADYTFRSDNPTRVIDWVLVSHHFVIQNYQIVDSPLSDHRPIVAEVLIK